MDNDDAKPVVKDEDKDSRHRQDTPLRDVREFEREPDPAPPPSSQRRLPPRMRVSVNPRARGSSKTTIKASSKKVAAAKISKRPASLPPVVKAIRPSTSQVLPPPSSQPRPRSPTPPEDDYPYPSLSFPNFADGSNLLDNLDPYMQERVLQDVQDAGFGDDWCNDIAFPTIPQDPVEFVAPQSLPNFLEWPVPPMSGEEGLSHLSETLQYDQLLPPSDHALPMNGLSDSTHWPWPPPRHDNGDSAALAAARALEDSFIDFNGLSESLVDSQEEASKATQTALTGNGTSGNVDEEPLEEDEVVIRNLVRQHIRFDDDGEPLEYAEPAYYTLLKADLPHDEDSDSDFAVESSSVSSLSSDSDDGELINEQRESVSPRPIEGPTHSPQPQPHPLSRFKWPGSDRLVSPHTPAATLKMAVRLVADRMVDGYGLEHVSSYAMRLRETETVNHGALDCDVEKTEAIKREDEWKASAESVSPALVALIAANGQGSRRPQV